MMDGGVLFFAPIGKRDTRLGESWDGGLLTVPATPSTFNKPIRSACRVRNRSSKEKTLFGRQEEGEMRKSRRRVEWRGERQKEEGSEEGG